MKRPGKSTPKTGRLDLSLSGGEYASLVAAGIGGAIPVTTWLMMLVLPLGGDRPLPSHEPWSAAVGVFFVVVALLVMLVAPWLVPVLVLRARQPGGARVAWDEEGITEWDGPWRRSFIAWSELRAAQVTWVTRTRTGPTTDEALQLFGAPDANPVTVWTASPRGVPYVRRRVFAKGVAELREAIEERGVVLSSAPVWRLAGDPDRPPHRALSITGRFGYPLAVFAPLAVPLSPVVGVALGATAAILLGVRAVPVFRELRAVLDRRRGPARREAALLDDAGPYRAAGVDRSRPPDPSEDDGRAAADALKLRAVAGEAIVRAGCVVLVVASTALGFLLH